MSDKKKKEENIMWSFVRPHKGLLLGGIVMNAFHGFAVTFQVFTIGWLLDWVLGKGQVPPDMWRRALLLGVGYFVASAVGRMLLWHLAYRIFTRVRERILFAMRARFYRQLNALCLRFHMKRSTGELYSYLFGSPLGSVVQFYQHCALGLAGAVTTIGSAVSMLIWFDGALTTILAVTVIVQVWMMNVARRVNRRLYLEFQKVEAGVTGTVADLLHGTRAVKIYAMENTVEGEFGEKMQLISSKSYHRDVRAHMEYMKQETWSYFSYAVLLVACAWRFSLGGISIGEVSMFMLAFQQLTPQLNIISTAFNLWGGAQASIERISEVLRTTSTTPDPTTNYAPVPKQGVLEMRAVHFAYEHEPVLNGISFTIPYGQSVALVGPSGSGKTTIAQLLLRLYDPTSGAVYFGGQNLRDCSGAEVRRRFGVVPQDPFIFRTTIRENICVARPDADDAAIEQACRQANIWDFVKALPNGLDTAVGEGGATLSGGQRQRIAIARALLINPPVFLFDEATSALDTLSEHVIQETLKTGCKGRTSIVIAHRLSTVKDCNRVLVLQNGVVVQDGTYDELANQEGLFRNLVRGQELAQSGTFSNSV